MKKIYISFFIIAGFLSFCSQVYSQKLPYDNYKPKKIKNFELVYNSNSSRQSCFEKSDSAFAEDDTNSLIFEFEMRLESIIMSVNIEAEHRTVLFPLNIELIEAINFSKILKADIRFGFIPGNTKMPDDFNRALELGFFLRIKLLGTNLYGICGLNILDNDYSYSHGMNHISHGGGLVSFLCTDFGYEISRYAAFDIMYSIPLKKTFGYDTNQFFSPGNYDKIVYGAIDIGLQFSLND